MDEQKVPLLLDTDIGSDIDDAVCLAYLLRQPRCEMLGITTVTGEPQKRAMLADMICRAAGRTDIPIHSGSGKQLFGRQLQLMATQAEVLDGHSHRTDFEPYTAVEFLRKTIRERPGEITLLTIGALTNIALLFALDPEIPGMLKRLVMMCGVFTTQTPNSSWRECNAIIDPIATSIVYQATVPEHISIGLDVTLHCTMESNLCREKFKGEPLETVAKMAEVWFREVPRITFHDPLAGAVIFDPEICKYQAGTVEVETDGTNCRGMTFWKPDTELKPHRIALEVNADRFFEHYFSVTSALTADHCE